MFSSPFFRRNGFLTAFAWKFSPLWKTFFGNGEWGMGKGKKTVQLILRDYLSFVSCLQTIFIFTVISDIF